MKLRILIVEDDMIIGLALEEVLEGAGHVVVGVAPTMDAALSAATDAEVDIAIMDVDLADGGNGVEVARRLRERHDIPSLFVSAKVSDELRAMASEWSPVGFIAKPFEERQILEALRRVCGEE